MLQRVCGGQGAAGGDQFPPAPCGFQALDSRGQPWGQAPSPAVLPRWPRECTSVQLLCGVGCSPHCRVPI